MFCPLRRSDLLMSPAGVSVGPVCLFR